MLEYDRIYTSEGSDINKINASKECDICRYWYFLYKNVKYEPYLCNSCHDLTLKGMKFSNVDIVSIKENDYKIHFWHMSKDDAINMINNFSLNEQGGSL